MVQIYPNQDRVPRPPIDAFGIVPRPKHASHIYYNNTDCPQCGKPDEIYNYGKWGWFASCEHLAKQQEHEAASLA